MIHKKVEKVAEKYFKIISIFETTPNLSKNRSLEITLFSLQIYTTEMRLGKRQLRKIIIVIK